MSAGGDARPEHAPAKVNLALHVTGQRPDRYHLLESLSVFTAFGDRVSITPGDRDGFSATGPFAASVPAGPDNLVLQARDAFRAAFFDAMTTPVSIVLEKNIPLVSGVGGGSSDAAATLRGLARLAALDPNDAALAGLAPALGADVPMCLAARPLIARGIGDMIEPVAGFPTLHLVLANPGIAVETPRVFAALETKHNEPLPLLPARLNAKSLVKWLARTRNDLFEPALQLAPMIGLVLAALAAQGASFARMSGSGATCFGLFADDEAAERAARAIRIAEPGWFVTATRTIATGG